MRDRAIVALMIGDEIAELGKLTLPSLTAYAYRMKADLVLLCATVLTKQRPELPAAYEKYQLGELLLNYARVVFFDLDIIVRPTCPDLFDAVPLGMMGAYVVSEHSNLHTPAMLRWLKAHDLDKKWDRRYFNSGVMVLDHGARKLFDLGLGHCPGGAEFGDQTQLNVNRVLLDAPLFDIGYRFNHTSVPDIPKTDSHVLHFVGGAVADKIRRVRAFNKCNGVKECALV